MPTTTQDPITLNDDDWTAVASAVDASTPRSYMTFSDDVVLRWGDAKPDAAVRVGTPAGPDDPAVVGGGGGSADWQGFTGTLWARSTSGDAKVITHANSA